MMLTTEQTKNKRTSLPYIIFRTVFFLDDAIRVYVLNKTLSLNRLHASCLRLHKNKPHTNKNYSTENKQAWICWDAHGFEPHPLAD